MGGDIGTGGALAHKVYMLKKGPGNFHIIYRVLRLKFWVSQKDGTGINNYVCIMKL